MKKHFLIFILLVWHTAGFAKNPPWMEGNEKIPANTNLDIRWENIPKFPGEVWTYNLQSNKFSTSIISNLMTFCSFTEKDKIEENASDVVFENAKGTRSLSISFSSGDIEFEAQERRFSRTNLAVGVPELSQLPQVVSNILNILDIHSSDFIGHFDTNGIEYKTPAMTVFYTDNNAITNIPYRTILVKRFVDGMPIAHRFCRFNVGEHGKVAKISMVWPTLKRAKSYS